MHSERTKRMTHDKARPPATATHQIHMCNLRQCLSLMSDSIRACVYACKHGQCREDRDVQHAFSAPQRNGCSGRGDENMIG